MPYHTRYNDTDWTGLSVALWKRCPWFNEHPDPSFGYGFFDDFINLPTIADGDTIGYGFHIPTGGGIAGSTSTPGGAIVLTSDGTDNDNIAMTLGGNIYAPFLMSDTAGSDKKLWFECRLKSSDIEDDETALFVGLTEEGLAADNAKTDDTGVMADKDYIGFESVHVNSGVAGTNALVNFTINKASGAGPTNVIATCHTLVADTYVKLGFMFDPTASPDKRVKIFVDGVEQATYVTAAVVATTAFPDGEEVTPLLLAHAGGAAGGSTLTMDWWACYQER